jgi:LacI family transcriptional regulator
MCSIKSMKRESISHVFRMLEPMRKVTLNDVARAAGVSVATASWAINNNRKVNLTEDTREKVRKAAAELGYHPNVLAKSLAQGSSSLIGFIADDVATTPFAGRIIEGAQDEAWRHGKMLLIINTDEKPTVETSAIRLMGEHQVDGIIYSTWYHRPIHLPDALLNHAVVSVNCFDLQARCPAVIPNERQGGYDATQELIHAGHQRIAFVNTTSPSAAQTGRLEGYRAALEKAGIQPDSSLIMYVQADQEGGYAAAERILASQATAVFCHNDRVAMGLYDAFRERGIAIPSDISIIGFDNQEVIAAHLHPALTSMGLPHYELGVLGVKRLLELRSNPEPLEAGEMNDVTRVTCPIFRRKSISKVPSKLS